MNVEQFAAMVARLILVGLAHSARIEPVKDQPLCWRCGRELRAHERPERICDVCLRASQW